MAMFVQLGDKFGLSVAWQTNLDAGNRETGRFEEQSGARGNDALANTGDDT